MFSTEYKALQTIGKSYEPYIGGITKWWYTPIENLNEFPVINPATQKLISEPVLKVGKQWYGPVNVPDRQLGWEEQMNRSVAGRFYKQRIQSFFPGNYAGSHINIGNLVAHEVCIVAKLRAGGFFIVLGNDQSGLDLDDSTSSGSGSTDVPGSKLMFSMDTKDKALVLDTFLGEGSIPPPIFGINITRSDMETIAFNPIGDTVVEWTGDLIARFGQFPTIEIWAKEAVTGNYYKANIGIDAVGDPPISFIIRNNGGDGKIKIM